eukprot:EG_transcript_35900
MGSGVPKYESVGNPAAVLFQPAAFFRPGIPCPPSMSFIYFPAGLWAAGWSRLFCFQRCKNGQNGQKQACEMAAQSKCRVKNRLFATVKVFGAFFFALSSAPAEGTPVRGSASSLFPTSEPVLLLGVGGR